MTALGWCRRLACWLVVGACLGALALGLLVPRVSGATPYTVLTGSMTPNLPPGTLVVVRPAQVEDIATGDVITYQLHSGRPTVVTHRVVQVRTTLTGEVEWQTKGDANSVTDQDWVRVEQVRGELWYAVPHLGRVNTALSTAQRELLAQAIAGLLLLYAAVTVGKGLATGRRRDAVAPVEPRPVHEEVSA